MIPVDSSMIKGVLYNADCKYLLVRFNNDSLYGYFNVPPKLFKELLQANSVGKFFHHNIRTSFEFEKVDY